MGEALYPKVLLETTSITEKGKKYVLESLNE